MTPTSRALPVFAAYESDTVEKRNAAASRCERDQPSIVSLLEAGTRYPRFPLPVGSPAVDDVAPVHRDNRLDAPPAVVDDTESVPLAKVAEHERLAVVAERGRRCAPAQDLQFVPSRTIGERLRRQGGEEHQSGERASHESLLRSETQDRLEGCTRASKTSVLVRLPDAGANLHPRRPRELRRPVGVHGDEPEQMCVEGEVCHQQVLAVETQAGGE